MCAYVNLRSKERKYTDFAYLKKRAEEKNRVFVLDVRMCISRGKKRNVEEG